MEANHLWKLDIIKTIYCISWRFIADPYVFVFVMRCKKTADWISSKEAAHWVCELVKNEEENRGIVRSGRNELKSGVLVLVLVQGGWSVPHKSPIWAEPVQAGPFVALFTRPPKHKWTLLLPWGRKSFSRTALGLRFWQEVTGLINKKLCAVFIKLEAQILIMKQNKWGSAVQTLDCDTFPDHCSLVWNHCFIYIFLSLFFQNKEYYLILFLCLLIIWPKRILTHEHSELTHSCTSKSD